MYGLIGKMSAKPGQRDALQAILLENDGGMPGCLSYIIAQDPRGCRRAVDHRGLGRPGK